MLAELEEVFRAPVIEGYGMTETCLYATSNRLPPLARKVGSVGIAVGIEVVIIDEKGAPLPAGPPGEIAVRGANIMTAYENNPGANGEAFIDGWFRPGIKGIWIATATLHHWKVEGDDQSRRRENLTRRSRGSACATSGGCHRCRICRASSNLGRGCSRRGGVTEGQRLEGFGIAQICRRPVGRP